MRCLGQDKKKVKVYAALRFMQFITIKHCFVYLEVNTALLPFLMSVLLTNEYIIEFVTLKQNLIWISVVDHICYMIQNNIKIKVWDVMSTE